MISFRTSLEIGSDRRVVLMLPPETPVGAAELLVTVAPQWQPADARPGSLRRQFGVVHSGNRRSADNERIDADLVGAYAESDHEAT